MSKRIVVVAAVLALAAAMGSCKKKTADQAPAAPAAQTPATPVPAAQPAPAPQPVEPPKPVEAVKPPEPTPPTPPPAAEVKTDVKGNVKGADIALGFAYARIEEGNEKIVISFRDKELPAEGFDCYQIDSSSPDAKVLYAMLPTGPKGDLGQGHAVPVDPMEFLNNEGDWSVDDGDAAITITKVDLANKVIEGSIIIDRKAGDEKGKLEGTFRAAVCTQEGVPMELKPSVPELATTPAAWKIGDKEFTVKSAAAKLVKNEDSGQEYWDIFVSNGDVTCDSLSIADGASGFDLMVYRGPDGQYPVGYAIPLDDWGYYPIPADVGSAADSRFCDLDEDNSAAMVSEIGTGENARLKGSFVIDQECSLTNATADADNVKFQTTGGGTFEAVICPSDE